MFGGQAYAMAKYQSSWTSWEHLKEEQSSLVQSACHPVRFNPVGAMSLFSQITVH